MLLYAAGEQVDYFEYAKLPDLLKFEEIKLRLKHLVRQAIRKRLLSLDPHVHLFNRIPKLGLPSLVTRYLLFNVSLDE